MELRKHITLLMRWWWLATLLVLAAAVASYLVSWMLPPIYQATTVVMVGQSIQAADLSNQDIVTSESLARTYADIAQRQPVLQGVIDVLDLDGTWRDLQERVQVRPVRDTQFGIPSCWKSRPSRSLRMRPNGSPMNWLTN